MKPGLTPVTSNAGSFWPTPSISYLQMTAVLARPSLRKPDRWRGDKVESSQPQHPIRTIPKMSQAAGGAGKFRGALDPKKAPQTLLQGPGQRLLILPSGEIS